MTATSEPTTRTLTVPGATLAYDVREGDSAEPPLLLIGSPMGAAGSAPRRPLRRPDGREANGATIEQEVDEASTGPASFILSDPDGNSIPVDQHR